jgi:hypothetical protein
LLIAFSEKMSNIPRAPGVVSGNVVAVSVFGGTDSFGSILLR